MPPVTVFCLGILSGWRYQLCPRPSHRQTWIFGVGKPARAIRQPLQDGELLPISPPTHPYCAICPVWWQPKPLLWVRLEWSGEETGEDISQGPRWPAAPPRSLLPWSPTAPSRDGGAERQGEGNAVGPRPQLHTKPFTFSLPPKLLLRLPFTEGLGCPLRWSAGRSDCLSPRCLLPRVSA